MTEIKNALFLLGIGPGYRGYCPVILSISMVLESEDRLLCISSSIYPAVGEQLDGSPRAVERNMRTVAKKAWKQNRALL